VHQNANSFTPEPVCDSIKENLCSIPLRAFEMIFPPHRLDARAEGTTSQSKEPGMMLGNPQNVGNAAPLPRPPPS
jgi:hypothetical protein